ncbi:MAG TPA: DUF1905 domain-containing protein [Pyrinomonadaceae bacterium]|nr:DUF1905 domain-containing protein [Pyrinomonadaceae bacterium]
MRKKRFKAAVQSGHKDDAVEVPFDPTAAWGLPPRPIWRGRRGHVVRGTLNGFAFAESFIVARQKKFYLMLDRELEQAAGVSVGDSVNIAIEPAALLS